ncbi:MAG TPA: hypothetical protein PLL77_15950, partial [Pyrinomonadaceae bacterium]|nr:hypothetical protein [Pyrinomonadaceae bacterium]
MSSVALVASPTCNPGTAVFPLGSVRVIVFGLVGVIVNLTIDVATAMLGNVTVKLPAAIELSINTVSALVGAPAPVHPLQLPAVAHRPSPAVPVQVHGKQIADSGSVASMFVVLLISR